MAAIDPYSLDENRRLFVSLGRVDWLGRAVTHAARMRDGERVERAVAATVSAATESLAREEQEPGVALGLIEALVDADRAEADELLERARAHKCLRDAGSEAEECNHVAGSFPGLLSRRQRGRVDRMSGYGPETLSVQRCVADERKA